jgi:hypothetical protein
MDLPSQNFNPHVYGVGAWTDNVYFAYDVVAALKPRLLVELGTDRGESYFAFCQSVAENHTGTRCFAVDSWRGDEQAGEYDETTFQQVTAHNDAHYARFSTLLRCGFDDALERFADESIDVLHLDGLHTEDAVRHDLDAWLRKVRPGGILLMHDVAVRGRGFGVWKVWDELRERGRSYTFTAGPGLGVWQKLPAVPLPRPLSDMLAGESPERTALADYYRHRAGELQERIAEQWRDRTIRETAAGQQTIIQIFYSRDGAHREDDSVLARIGHGEWKDVVVRLPEGAGAAPLRIDFVSPFTTIDIAALELTCDQQTLVAASNPSSFDAIAVAGDAERVRHDAFLRLRITGPDPQLYLPPAVIPVCCSAARIRMKLRVSLGDPND